MTPTQNSQECRVQDSPFAHMSNERHIFDLAVVNLANVGALAISLSEAEQWLRIASCLLAAVFTSLKIIETLKALRK